ncbi:MAG: hypothetical protein FWJ70_08080 [Micromonosporaceae bacterium]|jgi:hypothetical protein
MTDVLLPAARPPTPRSVRTVRIALGVVAAVVVAVTAVLFALGAWNPWELVLLKRHFGNPFAGLGLVAVGTYGAIWLLAPVRNETRQRGRIAVRVTLAVVAVVGFVVGGLLGPQFRYSANVVDESPDGDRTLAVVTVGGLQQRYLLVWQGRGLLAREVASLGQPCSRMAARFVSRDVVAVDQGYGEHEIRLDPTTAQPDRVLAPRCPDPPVPATLEP